MDPLHPSIGIGACLVGQKVRYNAEAKRKNPHIETLVGHINMLSFCPEMEIGLGVPREPVRLVGELGKLRLSDSATQSSDHTTPIRAYAGQVLNSNPQLAGYILVKGSPSCGFERVKRYSELGNAIRNDATGIFTAELARLDPLLPLEDDGRLYDHGLRENFISRVYAYHDWKAFSRTPRTLHGITQFWSRYKYMLLSRHVPSYKLIGHTLADARQLPIEDVAETFITQLMTGLNHIATRKSHTNVLQHIKGYLKRDLASGDKQELDMIIMQYLRGYIPLVVPITLLRHHFKRHIYDYVDQQVYMQPYPEQLSLRNLI